MTFDVTIPVLNEEPSLDRQVRVLHSFLKKHFPAGEKQWKIILADNGSTDRTPEIAENLAAEFPEIRLVRVPERGVGLALKTSWTQSAADFVGYMDLDLATDLPHFLEVYQKMETGFDFVYGSRLHSKSQVIGRTLTREITSRIFNLMLKFYLGTRFSDGMCGFKWLRREHVKPLIEAGANSNGWFFSTELLALAEWNSLIINELPVKWTDDTSGSKVNIPRLARQYMAAMAVLKTRRPT